MDESFKSSSLRVKRLFLFSRSRRVAPAFRVRFLWLDSVRRPRDNVEFHRIGCEGGGGEGCARGGLPLGFDTVLFSRLVIFTCTLKYVSLSRSYDGLDFSAQYYFLVKFVHYNVMELAEHSSSDSFYNFSVSVWDSEYSDEYAKLWQ